jgi:hypothetical protein
MLAIIGNHHNARQDILETFIDRGPLRPLAEPTFHPAASALPA